MQIKREKGIYTKLLPMITLGEKSWIADPFIQYRRTLWGPEDQQTCFPSPSGSEAGSIFKGSIPLAPSQTPSFLLFFLLFPEEVSLGLLLEVEKNGREDGGGRRKLTPITLAPGPVLEQCSPSAPRPLGQLLPAHWIESESVLVAFKAPVSSLPLGSPHSPAPHALTSLLLGSPSTLGLSPLVCQGSICAIMPVSLECRDFNFSPHSSDAHGSSYEEHVFSDHSFISFYEVLVSVFIPLLLGCLSSLLSCRSSYTLDMRPSSDTCIVNVLLPSLWLFQCCLLMNRWF